MKKPFIYLLLVALPFLMLPSQAQEKQKASPKSRMIYNSMKSSNIMDRVFENMINKPKRETDKVIAKKINRKLLTEEQFVEGFRMLTVQSSSSLKKHIIVFHGGAYVAEALKGHRRLIETLAQNYDFKVTFIDYPLAPEYNASYSHKIVLEAYNIVTESNKDDVFYLLGDSAGGGLALAFLQTLKNNKAPVIPEKTVLLSPWLDATMANPDIADYIEKDVLLRLDALIECATLYAGELELDNPLLSPINGDLEDLSNLKVFVSSHELFYP
ncbi:MAG: alpha/beta hydrolase, partial [Bacteroidales bacterium]|nr:alpha/beta hydrolase [Bacteroidales bacterium]